MSDQNRIAPVTSSAPQVAPSNVTGAAPVQVGKALQGGADAAALAHGREQLRDLSYFKAALRSDANAIRLAFESGLVNDTIDTTLRQLSTDELRRLANALQEISRGTDSRVAFASMVSRMPGLPLDDGTKRLLRATLVQTGYQGDIDRFDLAYPIR